MNGIRSKMGHDWSKVTLFIDEADGLPFYPRANSDEAVLDLGHFGTESKEAPEDIRKPHVDDLSGH